MNDISSTLEQSISYARRKLEYIGYGETTPQERLEILRVMGCAGYVALQTHLSARPYLHPTIAVVECALADPEIYMRWWVRGLSKVWLWFLHRQAAKLGDMPGINDGLMVRWFWTHDLKYVKAMAERARQINEIGSSCSWMLLSVRERDSALRQALADIGWFNLRFDEVSRPGGPVLSSGPEYYPF